MLVIHETALRVGKDLAEAGCSIDSRVFQPSISTLGFAVPGTVFDVAIAIRHIEAHSAPVDETDLNQIKLTSLERDLELHLATKAFGEAERAIEVALSLRERMGQSKDYGAPEVSPLMQALEVAEMRLEKADKARSALLGSETQHSVARARRTPRAA